MTCPFTHSPTQRQGTEVITWNEDGEGPLYAVDVEVRLAGSQESGGVAVLDREGGERW